MSQPDKTAMPMVSANSETLERTARTKDWQFTVLPVEAVSQDLTTEYHSAKIFSSESSTNSALDAKSYIIWDVAVLRQEMATDRYNGIDTKQLAHDECAAAHGIVLALAISISFWAIVGGIVWAIFA